MAITLNLTVEDFAQDLALDLGVIEDGGLAHLDLEDLELVRYCLTPTALEALDAELAEQRRYAGSFIAEAMDLHDCIPF